MTDTLRVWIRKAEADFKAAKKLLADFEPDSADIVCFHSRQTIEKLLKALAVQCEIAAPKVHDLVHLSELIRNRYEGLDLDERELRLLYRLSSFRYPGEFATKSDADLAFSLCQKYRERLLAHINWD